MRETYGAVLAREVGMASRDGVHLATDVWRPAKDGEPLPGPFPAIVMRTPYDRKAEIAEWNCEYWARHGFLGVIQDVRGRFGSGGEFELLVNEGPDGFDTIEWVAALPYCDGAVGTYGTSYSAWVQSAAAIECPPHLAAMWVNQGAANGNTSSLRHGGALELRWLTWAVTHGATSPEALADPGLQAELWRHGQDMYAWLQRLPWGAGNSPLASLPGYEHWARELYEHGDADAYWQRPGRNFAAHYDRSADVPTMYCGSWYDSYTRATLENFVALGTRKANQHALMGAWTHGDRTFDNSFAGEVDLGAGLPVSGNLVGERMELPLRWFDRWLRGVEPGSAGVVEEPPLRIFVMGGGSGRRTAAGRIHHGGAWREEQEWPLARAVWQNFYLAADGALQSKVVPPAGSAAARFDPANPLPTIAANTSSLNEIVPTPPRVMPSGPLHLLRLMVVQGGADQRTRGDIVGCEPPFYALEDRDDVLCFATEPLQDAIEVTGPVAATIHLQSDAPDTDLFVMLQDYYPPSEDYADGFRLNVADGIFRIRYRGGMDQPRMMNAGQIYPVRVELYPTSNRFAAGHRIRVLVSFSSFPRFDVNPNTGEPLGRHTRTQIANNVIHYGGDHASHVTLAVVPGGS